MSAVPYADAVTEATPPRIVVVCASVGVPTNRFRAGSFWMNGVEPSEAVSV